MGVDRWGVPARMVRLLHTGKWTSHPESRNKRQRKRDKKNKRDADNRQPWAGRRSPSTPPPPPPPPTRAGGGGEDGGDMAKGGGGRAGRRRRADLDADTLGAADLDAARSRRPSCGPSSSRARRTRASSRTTRGGPEQGEGHAAPAEPWPRRAAGRASSIEPAAPLQVCRTAHTHTLHLHSTPHLCFQNRYRRKFKQQIRAASSSSSKNARHQGIASRLPTQLTPLMGERHQRTPSCYSWGVITRTECKLRLF